MEYIVTDNVSDHEFEIGTVIKRLPKDHYLYNNFGDDEEFFMPADNPNATLDDCWWISESEREELE